MTPNPQAAILLVKAGDDIHVLGTLRDDVGTSDTIWGFHAQQAVEKLLKAMLAHHGVPFPFTHRLLELADLLLDAGHQLDAQYEGLLDLTPYAVELRYSLLAQSPGELPLDRAKILRLIVEMRDEVRAVIGRS